MNRADDDVQRAERAIDDYSLHLHINRGARALIAKAMADLIAEVRAETFEAAADRCESEAYAGASATRCVVVLRALAKESAK